MYDLLIYFDNSKLYPHLRMALLLKLLYESLHIVSLKRVTGRMYEKRRVEDCFVAESSILDGWWCESRI